VQAGEPLDLRERCKDLSDHRECAGEVTSSELIQPMISPVVPAKPLFSASYWPSSASATQLVNRLA
jgi:hypothetical protein